MGGYGAGMVPVELPEPLPKMNDFFTSDYWARLAKIDRQRQQRAAERAWMARCSVRRQLLCGASDLALAAL